MADLEQKVSELEASTYDGVFIWKISDFARKRQEAVAGRTPAIFSPGAICGLPSASEAVWNGSLAGAGHILSWHQECLRLLEKQIGQHTLLSWESIGMRSCWVPGYMYIEYIPCHLQMSGVAFG